METECFQIEANQEEICFGFTGSNRGRDRDRDSDRGCDHCCVTKKNETIESIDFELFF